MHSKFLQKLAHIRTNWNCPFISLIYELRRIILFILNIIITVMFGISTIELIIIFVTIAVKIEKIRKLKVDGSTVNVQIYLCVGATCSGQRLVR